MQNVTFGIINKWIEKVTTGVLVYLKVSALLRLKLKQFGKTGILWKKPSRHLNKCTPSGHSLKKWLSKSKNKTAKNLTFTFFT